MTSTPRTRGDPDVGHRVRRTGRRTRRQPGGPPPRLPARRRRGHPRCAGRAGLADHLQRRQDAPLAERRRSPRTRGCSRRSACRSRWASACSTDTSTRRTTSTGPRWTACSRTRRASTGAGCPSRSSRRSCRCSPARCSAPRAASAGSPPRSAPRTRPASGSRRRVGRGSSSRRSRPPTTGSSPIRCSPASWARN